MGADAFVVHDAATPEGLAAWTRLWEAWPGREVMAHPEFARLFARPGDRLVCAAAGDASGAVLFPLILRPLAAEPWARVGEKRWDATTPYGYGGPFVWGGGAALSEAFWRAHADWCRREGVVTTFARLSLFPEDLAAMPAGVEIHSPNIVMPLSAGMENLWNISFDKSVRTGIRKAEKSGLTIERDGDGSRLEDFYAIYTHTMSRNNASDWYFFPRELFRALIEKLPGRFMFFFALKDGKPVSSELLLVSAQRVYSFLAGTYEDAFQFNPNYLIKQKAAEWAIGEKKSAYVLGGGYAPGDSLFKHKRAFAKDGEAPFKVARWVHDQVAADDLVAARTAYEAAQGKTWAPKAGFFPSYRA